MPQDYPRSSNRASDLCEPLQQAEAALDETAEAGSWCGPSNVWAKFQRLLSPDQRRGVGGREGASLIWAA